MGIEIEVKGNLLITATASHSASPPKNNKLWACTLRHTHTEECTHRCVHAGEQTHTSLLAQYKHAHTDMHVQACTHAASCMCIRVCTHNTHTHRSASASLTQPFQLFCSIDEVLYWRCCCPQLLICACFTHWVWWQSCRSSQLAVVTPPLPPGHGRFCSASVTVSPAASQAKHPPHRSLSPQEAIARR